MCTLQVASVPTGANGMGPPKPPPSEGAYPHRSTDATAFKENTLLKGYDFITFLVLFIKALAIACVQLDL